MYIPTVGHAHCYVLPLWLGLILWAVDIALLLSCKKVMGFYFRATYRRMEDFGNTKLWQLAKVQGYIIFSLLEIGLFMLGKLIMNGYIFTLYN